MVWLGFEPRTAGWEAQTNPLSYGATLTKTVCLIMVQLSGGFRGTERRFIYQDQSWLLYVYFRRFLITIQFQIDKSVDIVLGNRTQGRRMVSADGTTELGWPPWSTFVFWQIGGLHYNLKKLTTGTVVVYTRDLQFESSHWQIVFTVLKSRHQLLTIRYSF